MREESESLLKKDNSDSTYYTSYNEPLTTKPSNKKTTDSERTFNYNPEENASWFSKLTFGFITPLMALGVKRPLTDKDVFPIQDRDESLHNYEQFAKNWDLLKETKTKRILLWSLQKTFGWELHLTYISKCVADLCEFLFPLMISKIIDFLQDPSLSVWYGLLYSLILTIGYLVNGLCESYWQYKVRVISLRVRSSLINAVYKKSLSVSNSVRERDGQSKGNTVNLMTVDVDTIREFITYFQYSLSVPIQIIICIVLLYQLIKWSTFVGFGTLVLFFPLNFLVGMKAAKINEQVMAVKDERASKVSEAIQSIRVLKFYGWARLMYDRIMAIRLREVELIKKELVLNAFLTFFWEVVPDFVIITGFSTFILVGDTLSVNTLVTALSLFFIVRFPLSLLPHVLTGFAYFMVSVNRVEKFLVNEELPNGYKDSKQSVHFGAVDNTQYINQHKLAISIQNASFKWTIPKVFEEEKEKEEKEKEKDDSEIIDRYQKSPLLDKERQEQQQQREQKNVLSDITLDIPKCKLSIIIGPVGSGKTSLLSAILGDMKLESGGFSRNGKIAYVSQLPWILNGTVRDNIIFGAQFDEKRYQKVLETCCLIQDLNILPGSDLCEIGERGINLSGGQKQRVAIARAVYSDSDLFLFDDPLAALDLDVATQVFENAIKTLCPAKTCILVTHQKFPLESADIIVSMKDGTIDRVGTYSDFPQEQWDIFNIEHKAPDEAKLDKKDDDGELIDEESRNVGKVLVKDYITYFKNIGYKVMAAIFVLSCVSPGLSVFTNYWVTLWSDESMVADKSKFYFIGVYIGVTIIMGIFTFASKLVTYFGGIKASQKFHNRGLIKVLRSPIQFFDQNLSGRILNRFTKDIAKLDLLPEAFGSALDGLIYTSTYFIMIAIASPVVLVVIVPMFWGLWVLQKWFLANERELQRLVSTSMSPVITHFAESLSGQQVIRAFGACDRFFQENVKVLNKNTEIQLTEITVAIWTGLRLGLLCASIISSLTLSAALLRNHVSPSLIGLALSYCVLLVGDITWMFHQLTYVEVQMNCVERLQDYCDLVEEAPDKRPDNQVPPSWPSNGEIVFKDYHMKYRPELSPSLVSINLTIPAGSKVGICGRTGAGKSSLLLALFRLIEGSQGSISIDGYDISQIGLEDLRTKMSIIPQDPVLFAGTIRYNLDPFDQFSDKDIWDILEKVRIKSFVESLETKVTEDGTNFSVGQRQLMCLARALLRKSKIIALDEATASVDMDTDELIQTTIRSHFKQSTIITIAHRLQTIMDYDYVVVMAEGKVQTIGKPHEVLLKQDPSL